MSLKRILFVGLIIVVSSQALILSYYNFSTLYFCWRKECLAYALNYFDLPLKLIYAELYLFGFIVAIATLHQQSRSANAVNFAAHFEYFDRLVEKKKSKLVYLRDVDLATPLLYAACFPTYTAIRSTPNRSDQLKKWRQAKKNEMDLFAARGSNGFDLKKHYDEISPYIIAVGIYIEDVDPYTFLRIEKDCYELLAFIAELGGKCDLGDAPAYAPAA